MKALNKTLLPKLFLLLSLLLVLVDSNAEDIKEDENMYFRTTVVGDFNAITVKVKKALDEQGFSVITEIDMDKKLNEKLKKDLRPYKILGACNPAFAYETLMIDDNIGVFLPCKIIIKQLDGGKIEVVSINPSVLMGVLNNPDLIQIAEQVSIKLKTVIDSL